MGKSFLLRNHATCLTMLLLSALCQAGNDSSKPESWVRTGDLGAKPEHVSETLPLSDQGNEGRWEAYEYMSDEFDGATLDANKWWPRNPGWLGRQPAYFHPGNVRVHDGKLHLTMRKQEVPQMPKDKGYRTYTSAAVKSKTMVRYGYFEIRARPMKSHGSSSFWFYDSVPEQWTEIDVFEIGGRAPGFERKYNMNVHVFRTPEEERHWSVHAAWTAPFDLANDYHVYGLEWDRDRLAWYVDGVLVRWVENTHWHQPLTLNFDRETMPKWFGLPRDEDLPSTYSIEYVRAWKQADPPETTEMLDRLVERMKTSFGENRGNIKHTMRVYAYACDIHQAEVADSLTVKAAALLHDIGIPKAREVHGSSAGPYQEKEGPPIARDILTELGMDAGRIDHVCRIIANHHTAHDPETTRTLEFKIVWDADWMVNFPGRYKGKAKEQLRPLVAETFRTSHGRFLANQLFVE